MVTGRQLPTPKTAQTKFIIYYQYNINVSNMTVYKRTESQLQIIVIKSLQTDKQYVKITP